MAEDILSNNSSDINSFEEEQYLILNNHTSMNHETYQVTIYNNCVEYFAKRLGFFMNLEKEIAKIAALMGDKTRAAMLIALMEGRALTAGELALRANISAQTASNHLKKMLDAKLIIRLATPTRYRYYKIATPLVARALESLSLLTTVDKMPPPRHEKLDWEICFARTCETTPH